MNLGEAWEEILTFRRPPVRFSKAVELQTADADAHLRLGNVLFKLDLHDRAIACYQRAIELNPNSAGAYSNLARSRLDLGRVDEAIALQRQAVQLAPDDTVVHDNLLYAMHLSDSVEAAELLHEHEMGRALLPPRFQPSFRCIANGAFPGSDTCRVGYVSADFHRHPVATFFRLPILIRPRSA